MNAIETTIAGDRAEPAAKNFNPSRFFYLAAALVLLAIVLTGFQQFYLHGRGVGGQQITPQILMLVITHGVLMSMWIVLFIVQPLLIVTHHQRWHMMLGRFAAILVVAIIVVGISVAIESARLHQDSALGIDWQAIYDNSTHGHAHIFRFCIAGSFGAAAARNTSFDDASGHAFARGSCDRAHLSFAFLRE